MARRSAVWFLSLVLTLGCGLLALPASGSVVVVPDDQLTIQAAIDTAPDTVLVKDGIFPERVQVPRGVTLLNYRPPDYYSTEALPVVAALAVVEAKDPPGSGAVTIRGFHFLGPVTVIRHARQMALTFEGCRMDSGMAGPPGGELNDGIVILTIRGCTIVGGVNVSAYSANVTLNAVIGGGLRVLSEGYQTVRGNYVTGAAVCGIDGENRFIWREGLVEGNTVVGADLGIRVYGPTRRNEVLDCKGNGFQMTEPHAVAKLQDNVVRRCGGNGIELSNTESVALVSKNTIDGAGGTGIHCVSSFAVIDSNVVGRSVGDGIRSEGPSTASYNTTYLNGGSGLSFLHSDGNLPAFHHNIAFENSAYGMIWGGESDRLSCNDWFGNRYGPIKGVAGESDLQLDPLFCDVGSDNIALRADSPLLDAPGCGQIGALGLGCEASSSYHFRLHREQLLGLAATPVPARGTVQLSWQPVSVPVRLEVFDATGARRLSRVLLPGASSAQWDGDDLMGRRLPSGVYFAKVIGPGIEVSRRVVLVH